MMRYSLGFTQMVEPEDNDNAIKRLRPQLEEIASEMIHHADTEPDLDEFRDDPPFHPVLAKVRGRMGSAAGEPAQ